MSTFMSTFLAGLLMVGGTLLIGVLMHVVINRRVSMDVLKEHNEVAGSFIHVTGAIYGIFLAFMVTVAWEGHDRARRIVTTEANSAATMIRLSTGLPPPVGPELRSDTIGYIEGVIDDEWPLMSHGRTSEIVNQHLANMWRSVVSFDPKTDGQRDVHQQALSDMRALGDERRLRVYESQRKLPTLVWGIIALGNVIILALVSVLGLRFGRSKLLMTTELALSLGVIAFTIDALSRPFSGAASIPPDDFRAALQVVQDHPAVAQVAR